MNEITFGEVEAAAQEYCRPLVQDIEQLRNFVTNRLIRESLDEDPAIRMKSLELLSKRVDTALYGATSTTNNFTLLESGASDALKQNLRAKLAELVTAKPPVLERLKP